MIKKINKMHKTRKKQGLRKSNFYEDINPKLNVLVKITFS